VWQRKCKYWIFDWPISSFVVPVINVSVYIISLCPSVLINSTVIIMKQSFPVFKLSITFGNALLASMWKSSQCRLFLQSDMVTLALRSYSIPCCISSSGWLHKRFLKRLVYLTITHGQESEGSGVKNVRDRPGECAPHLQEFARPFFSLWFSFTSRLTD